MGQLLLLLLLFVKRTGPLTYTVATEDGADMSTRHGQPQYSRISQRMMGRENHYIGSMVSLSSVNRDIEFYLLLFSECRLPVAAEFVTHLHLWLEFPSLQLFLWPVWMIIRILISIVSGLTHFEGHKQVYLVMLKPMQRQIRSVVTISVCRQ